MKLSVIVPCYNVEAYIRECVDSILIQDLTDFEVILVNDGSPDKCLEIIEDYKSKNTRIKIVNRANAGLAVARNNGIEVAVGKYIYFIDSDDYLSSSDFLSSIYHEIEDNDLDMVMFNWTNLKNNTLDIVNFPISIHAINTQPIGEALLSLIKNDCFPNASWARIVRRSFIIDNDLYFDPFLRRCQDIDWNIRLLAKVKKIRVLDYPKYVYRIRDTSLKVNPVQKSGWEYRYYIINKHYTSLLHNETMDNSLKKALLGFLAYTWLLCLGSVTQITNKQENSDAYKKLKDLQPVTEYVLSKKTKLAKTLVLLFGIRLGSKIIEALKHR